MASLDKLPEMNTMDKHLPGRQDLKTELPWASARPGPAVGGRREFQRAGSMGGAARRRRVESLILRALYYYYFCFTNKLQFREAEQLASGHHTAQSC